MAEKKPEKSLFLIYAEYIPFRILYGLFYAMPLRWGYAVSCFFMRLLYFADRRHVTRSKQHMLHAGIVSSPREAAALTRRTFAEFGKLLVEIVKMRQLYSSECSRFVGAESALNRLLPERNPEGPRNVIIVTAHAGNWEVAGTAFSEKSATPMTSLMRPFGNPKIGKLILDHRAGGMHTVEEKSKGIRPLLKALNNKEHATILIDQHAAGAEGVVCEFFGHPASVHMTPALLHLKTGVPILPELTVRVGEFKFELRCGELIEYKSTGDKEKDIRKVTQMCISGLEKLIREVPEQWSWAPRHWRDINRRRAEEFLNWRPETDDETNSSGADVSGK